MNLTETVRLSPRSKVTGKDGPEMENCPAEVKILTIVISCQYSFVMVTVRAALAEPSDSLPKLTKEGFAFTRAWATPAKAKAIDMATAPVRILFMIFPAICIFLPRLSFVTGPLLSAGSPVRRA